MSAVMTYLRVPEATLDQLLGDPQSVHRWWGDFEENLLPGSETIFDTAVLWHCLQYVLNGETHGGTVPLWNVVLGGSCMTPGPIVEDGPGHFVADLDTLWESVRYLRPSEVKEAALALESLDENVLRERFNIQLMRDLDIYSVGGLDADDEDREFIDLLTFCYDLRDWFGEAARAGDVILIQLA